MNLKLKDIVAIAVVMIVSFPVVYFCMMLAAGTARVEFGQKDKPAEEVKQIEQVKSTTRKDSLANANSYTYQAVQQERISLENERKRLQEQQQRVEMSAKELEAQKEVIAQERKKLEALVLKNDSLEEKRVKQLAKVYAAMRPAEAAQIIETLEDNLAGKIISSISDDRIKGKLMASLSQEKAARISRTMGK